MYQLPLFTLLWIYNFWKKNTFNYSWRKKAHRFSLQAQTLLQMVAVADKQKDVGVQCCMFLKTLLPFS